MNENTHIGICNVIIIHHNHMDISKESARGEFSNHSPVSSDIMGSTVIFASPVGGVTGLYKHANLL